MIHVYLTSDDNELIHIRSGNCVYTYKKMYIKLTKYARQYMFCPGCYGYLNFLQKTS